MIVCEQKPTASCISYDEASINYEDFDACPADYQHHVIRILSMQAYAERMGATEVGSQLTLAPDYIVRKQLAKIAYDEASHAYLLYDILNRIQVPEEEAISIAEGRHPRYSKTISLEGVIAVGHKENTWLDMILNNCFMDRAGAFMVDNFSKSSFKPWADACKRIYKDETWHIHFGSVQLKHFAATHPLEDIRSSFTVWYIRALNFFGPSFSRSQEQLAAYGIKRTPNAELRNQFILNVSEWINQNNLSALLPKVSNDYPYTQEL